MTFEAKEIVIVGLYLMFDIVKYLSTHLIDISEKEAHCDASLRNVFVISSTLLCLYSVLFAILAHKCDLGLKQLRITGQGKVVAVD